MSRVRFGNFDFDPVTGHLQRDGSPVRLQPQPAQVLAVLLARPGQVVTREELRKEVWGEGTFVDFDGGLNFCIAQIRSALGDSADSPRFLKTVPKKGYQFIAPVAPLQPEPVSAPVPRKPSRLEAIMRLGMLLVCVTTMIMTGRMLWKGNPDPIRLAVVRFDNETGSPELDRFSSGLTDLVVTDLSAHTAGRLAVIGNAAILRQAREQRNLTAIGSSLQVSYVVLGQVQRDASRLRVLAHLIRVPEQTHVSVWRQEWDATAPLPPQDTLARAIAAQFVAFLLSSQSANP